MKTVNFMLIAGFSESLINFRGPLIAELLATGANVHVVAPNLPPGSRVRQQLETFGCRVYNIPLRRTGTNPLADMSTLLRLWRLMRRIRPTHVLAYTIKPVIYGSLAARWAGVPHRYALITGLGYAFSSLSESSTVRHNWIRSLVQFLYSKALRGVSRVFFQNPDDQALFHRLGILSPKVSSVVVNGSGIDIASFSLVALPEGAPHFLLIARLLGDKGVREYARAAQRVKLKCPQARFSLVGWLDENPDAIEQAELDQWLQQGTLDFHGRLSDVRPAIANCTVYVLPSYREGTPRTVLEAMAMGRPIITTDAPGCRETVVEGDNGFLIPVKSVDALAQAMLKFIEDPTLAPRMGQRSRQIAEEKYDVHKVNAVMLREMGIE